MSQSLPPLGKATFGPLVFIPTNQACIRLNISHCTLQINLGVRSRGPCPWIRGPGNGRSPNPKVWGRGLPLHPPPPGVSGFLPVTRSAVKNGVTRWARGTRGAWRDRACRGRGLPCFSCCPSTAPVFVGRGRGRDSFETMAEMMVHDHFRRWCAAGGRLLREKGGPAGGPAASTLRQGLRRGQRENGGGQSGPGICPVFTRRTGENGGRNRGRRSGTRTNGRERLVFGSPWRGRCNGVS